MLDSSTKYFLKDADLQNFTFSHRKNQHGIQNSRSIRYPILLDVPAETLTCITSYLGPPSLLSIAQVNSYLNRHVNDENTWRRAFICHFLGIGPQLDFNRSRAVLLRRSEVSWRNEFMVRYRLRRRWERSRNNTMTHTPVHSNIAGMHQLVSNSLLTLSLEYGIVARSTPLTGRILPGYLNASGSTAGLGIGNPNAEFTPNISACAITSDGETAKLVWGSSTGDVLFMSVSNAMGTASRRDAAEVKRCSVADEHQGAVTDAFWLAVQPEWVVTGGADARVKVWDAKLGVCVWTSQQVVNPVIPDSCIKITGSVHHGFVAGVFSSGNIHIWAGFDFVQKNFSADNITEIVIHCPIRTETPDYSSENQNVTTLVSDPSASNISVLVGYDNHRHFYRVQVDRITWHTQILTFGKPSSVPISALVPFFGKGETESSIIFVGDNLGCISLYDWNADRYNLNPRTNTVSALKKFEAHRDGASVTSIAWNGLVLVSGSIRGHVRVFDGMNFEFLRSFESPNPRFGRRGTGTDVGMERQRREGEMVRCMLLGPEKDVLFMGVGNKVVAWKAGPVPKYLKAGVRGRNISRTVQKKTGHGVKQFDYLTQDIIESQDILEDEASFVNHTHGAREREQDQRQGLAALGLSEIEAVEYVLMLSRDDANKDARGGTAASDRQDVDEGVFEGDFEDNRMMPASATTPTDNISFSHSGGSFFSGHRSVSTSPTCRNEGFGHPIRVGNHSSRFSPSSNSSNSSKIQLSPPYRAEALEAGEEWKDGDKRGDEHGERLELGRHYFPAIETVSVEIFKNESQDIHSCKQCPKSNKMAPLASAWSTPLTKKLTRLEKGSNVAGSVPSSQSASSSNSGVVSGLTMASTRSYIGVSSGDGVKYDISPRTKRGEINLDEMDDDLRLAIELSLAEAESKAGHL